MLEGKCEENRIPKDIELTPQKNRSEQEQKKRNVEKEKGEPREIEKMKKER